jgi:signal transduction histidine kinase
MAVKSVRVADFYARQRVLALGIGLIGQFVILLCVTGLALLCVNLQWLKLDQALLTSFGLYIGLEIIFVPFYFFLVSGPLRVLTDAILHVSHHPNAVTPPNINKPRYEKSGLKALVQTVYDLSVASFQGTLEKAAPAVATNQDPTVLQPPSPLQDSLRAIMRLLPVEMVVFRHDSSISFMHGNSAVHTDTHNQTQLQLLFPNEYEFQNWLEDCRLNKIEETKVWKRIANELPDNPDGSSNRKIFDVVVHYEKDVHPDVETVMLLVDRTEDYKVDEDNMDFIALAAHELRAPITVIRGYVDVLGDELGAAITDDQKELLKRIDVSTSRLAGYINNILNVSKYDHAHLKLFLKEDSLLEILRDLARDLNARATTQLRKLNFKIPQNLPTIAADRNSLSEVITNFVDNAVKYSKEGGEIIIAASVKGNFVELTVQDFGIGIPTSIVGNLFKKFYRSHRSSSSVIGTGLGLYVSKAIVESHGGQVWVRSEEGQGSTFGILIPIYATVAEKIAASTGGNEGIIESSNGWIKNHSMYRR